MTSFVTELTQVGCECNRSVRAACAPYGRVGSSLRELLVDRAPYGRAGSAQHKDAYTLPMPR